MGQVDGWFVGARARGAEVDAALAAHRVATRGRPRRAARLLDELEGDARVLAWARGLVDRRRSRFEPAGEHLAEAARRSEAEGDHSLAAVALALAMESFGYAGKLSEAERTLDGLGWSPDLLAWSRAALSIARGQGDRARGELRAALPLEGAAAPWGALLRAEAFVEMEALVGARAALDELKGKLDDDRFGEARLRALWLEARCAISERLRDPAVDVRDPARRLVRYAEAFPLFRAWAAELEAEALLLDGKDAAARFDAAVEEARAASPYVLARIVTRQSRMVAEIERARRSELVASARTLLAEAGAAGHLNKLSASTQTEGGVRASRMSIALRLEQDVASLDLDEAQGLEAVIEVSRYLNTIRRLDELLDKVLDPVARVMGSERSVLLACSAEDATEPVSARGLSLEEAASEISMGVVEEARRTGEPVLSDNALADMRFRERASVMATDIRSVLCCPVRTRERTLGFFYLDRRATGEPFSLEHQDLLAALATQIAVAWENALAFEEIESLNEGLEMKVKERTVELRATAEELQRSLDELTNTRLALAEAERDALEKEMSLAREIQRSILPDEVLHAHGRARVAGRVIPASYCGGDFWSLRELDDGGLLLLVADVTGHGVAASLITATAGSCLDTLDHLDTLRSPAEVLEVLNDVIHRAAGGQLCATAFAAFITADGQALRYANAGHNFPYVLRGGEAKPIVARGVRLGEGPTPDFNSGEVPLEPGDRFVLFTDGIVEWMNPKGKEYGDRRFRKSLVARRGLSPEETLSALIEDAEDFAKGVERDDDLTLVVADLIEGQE